MTDDFLPLSSRGYWTMLALLLLARGMDFLSTWVATPTLVLEGNPLAKKLGWKLGGLVNLVLCVVFAFWPLTALIIITAGLLVAAHNFRSAWLMRSMGEEAYREWFLQQISRARLPLFIACLLGETLLTALIGGGLICYGGGQPVPIGIGWGIVAFAFVVLFYTALSLWRSRGRMG